jgi:hypothetical protein
MLAILLAVLLGAQAQAPQPATASRYAEGQVWEYRTRPGDEGSLLKIQRVEPWPAGGAAQVYHISVIGVRLGGRPRNQIQHLPVSSATLDASVTRLSGSRAAFPSPDEGIAMWREAQGGVFDIPLAEIIGIADRQIPGPASAAPPVT